MSKIMGEKLSEEQCQLFNQHNLTAVVATVSSDGMPNTAPMALFYAPDPKTILMCIGKMHDTYQNIEENGKVMINLVNKEDHAFSVRGKGEIVRETSQVNDAMAIVKIQVEEVKNDQSPVARAVEEIRLQPKSGKTREFLDGLQEELENFST